MEKTDQSKRIAYKVCGMWRIVFWESSFLPTLGKGLVRGEKEVNCWIEGVTLGSAVGSLLATPGCILGFVNGKADLNDSEQVVPFPDDWQGVRTLFRIDWNLIQQAQRLDCPRLYCNRENNYICGTELDQEDCGYPGEYGGCVVEGYNTPGFYDCPLDWRSDSYIDDQSRKT